MNQLAALLLLIGIAVAIRVGIDGGGPKAVLDWLAAKLGPVHP